MAAGDSAKLQKALQSAAAWILLVAGLLSGSAAVGYPLSLPAPLPKVLGIAAGVSALYVLYLMVAPMLKPKSG